jgi:hypothetical protein
MSAAARGGRLGGMNFSTHSLSRAHPVDTGWVDAALADAYETGDPRGALIGWPLGGGDGLMIVGWPDGGPGPFRLIESRRGRSDGPARYVQIVAFDGPRSPEWAAAEQRAATDRLGPATQDIQGIVQTIRLRADDNATLVVILAETADAIDEGIRAVMSTSLLPDEDPALLTDPDRIGIYRLMHADLPVEPVQIEGSHP